MLYLIHWFAVNSASSKTEEKSYKIHIDKDYLSVLTSFINKTLYQEYSFVHSCKIVALLPQYC